MAECYVCDACGVTITDPYKVKMKEFHIGCNFTEFGDFPVCCRMKKKIHLCDECYHALRELAKEGDKGGHSA